MCHACPSSSIEGVWYIQYFTGDLDRNSPSSGGNHFNLINCRLETRVYLFFIGTCLCHSPLPLYTYIYKISLWLFYQLPPSWTIYVFMWTWVVALLLSYVCYCSPPISSAACVFDSDSILLLLFFLFADTKCVQLQLTLPIEQSKLEHNCHTTN